jgi:hypothetical protein
MIQAPAFGTAQGSRRRPLFAHRQHDHRQQDRQKEQQIDDAVTPLLASGPAGEERLPRSWNVGSTALSGKNPGEWLQRAPLARPRLIQSPTDLP